MMPLLLFRCPLKEHPSAPLCLPKTSSLQVRRVEVDRRVPAVVVVGDHFGTAAWQVAAAA